MYEIKKRPGDSGANYILDLDGPDGNVYFLWSLLERFIDEDAIEESKNGAHYENGNCPYEGYERVLDYCLHHLQGCPAAIDFKMYGHDVQQMSDYYYAMRQQFGEYQRISGGGNGVV